MTKEQVDFDDAFKTQGGLFYIKPESTNGIDIVFASLKEHIDLILNHFYDRTPSLPQINSNFVRNLALNACAKLDKSYFIGLNIGSILLIQDMFLKIFSSSNLLMDIGSPKLETSEKKYLSSLWDNGICYDLNGDLMSFPIDETRSLFAKVYIDMAFEFLVLHEIGHISRGHLGYIKSIGKKAFWSEFDFENKLDIEMHNRQTLEMDADSFATNNSFLHFLAINKELSSIDINAQKIYKDIKSFARHWSFSIYCFFRLMGIEAFDIISARKLSHPPSSERMAMLMSNFYALVSIHFNKEIADEVGVIFLNSINEAENAFTKITFQENKSEIFIRGYLSSADYVNEVRGNWDNVRPLLEMFAFSELPPLQKDTKDYYSKLREESKNRK